MSDKLRQPLDCSECKPGQSHLTWLSRQRKSIMLKSGVYNKKKNHCKCIKRSLCSGLLMEVLHLPYWHSHCDIPCLGGENEQQRQGVKQQGPRVTSWDCVAFSWEAPNSWVPFWPIQRKNFEGMNYFKIIGEKLYFSRQRDQKVLSGVNNRMNKK